MKIRTNTETVEATRAELVECGLFFSDLMDMYEETDEIDLSIVLDGALFRLLLESVRANTIVPAVYSLSVKDLIAFIRMLDYLMNSTIFPRVAAHLKQKYVEEKNMP